MTATILNTKISELDNIIPHPSSLVTSFLFNTKIREVENNILDHAKYVTTPDFNKLTPENIATRLKQANIVNKTGFDNKLISVIRKITSNKTKDFEFQNKLITKD